MGMQAGRSSTGFGRCIDVGDRCRHSSISSLDSELTGRLDRLTVVGRNLAVSILGQVGHLPSSFD
jgi:hypothetical protein